MSRPPLGHGVHRVEHEVGERLADLAFRGHDEGQVGCQLRCRRDHHPLLQRHVAPTGPRERKHLLRQLVQGGRRKRHVRLAPAVELPHPGDGRRHVLDGALDRLQRLARRGTEVRLALEQELGVDRGGADGVVDVVGNAARHLPQGAQALVLQRRQLALPQVVIGPLQGTVDLCLVRGQGHVLAQLPEELAVRAAERLGFPPRGHQGAEYLALQQQRRHDQRAQALGRQPLREREVEAADVRLVDQLSPE